MNNIKKTILITGSTDGIGLLTAKELVKQGHNVLIHGRNSEKLKKVKEQLELLKTTGEIDSFKADLSSMAEVKKLSKEILAKYKKLDVLINNAGIYKVNETLTVDGFDVRFAVNTIAPYILVKDLLPIMNSSSRVINLSSAAQASVDLDALKENKNLSSGEAYAQSKLAITMWSFELATTFKNSTLNNAPSIIAVNPKSLLASKMVKEAYGIEGSDLSVGSDILIRASLSDEFKNASGKYFDNDIGKFASPHSDALNAKKCKDLVSVLEEIISKFK